MILEKINLTHTELTLFENRILEIKLGTNFFYTLAEAKEINNAMELLFKNGKMKALLVAGTYSDCDTSTRKYISSDEICQKLDSMALVTQSLAHELLANFIINFDKPTVPAKAFKSKEKAMQWLLKE